MSSTEQFLRPRTVIGDNLFVQFVELQRNQLKEWNQRRKEILNVPRLEDDDEGDDDDNSFPPYDYEQAFQSGYPSTKGVKIRDQSERSPTQSLGRRATKAIVGRKTGRGKGIMMEEPETSSD
ncbi:hypothetical protein PVK06_007409 [Gossypium arboreum]|uniref:Uncharacterized protein n=1 Tax=Gossypium arboreum TaxID=29729 RepID=A0ABR0QH87_GOSAR|nr:hypothetical protein PVK06_007409 [Gossypium arboreum]